MPCTLFTKPAIVTNHSSHTSTIHALLRHQYILVTLRDMSLCPHARQQIDHEAKNVECEDKSDDPFEYGGFVPVVRVGCGHEDDGENHLDDDEDEFDPEADGQDPVVSVMDSQTLVLGAEEDGADNVSSDEDQQEAVVHPCMVICVENAQQDQPSRTRDSEEYRDDTEYFLGCARVLRQTTRVAQPAFCDEPDVEKHDCYYAAGDEERFQLEGAYVGDVGYGLACFHRRVMEAIVGR